MWAQESRDKQVGPAQRGSQAGRGRPPTPNSTSPWKQPTLTWSPMLGTAWESELEWGPQPLETQQPNPRDSQSPDTCSPAWHDAGTQRDSAHLSRVDALRQDF